MPNIKLIDNSESPLQSEENQSSSSLHPLVAATTKTVSFPLELGGDAVFSNPTIRHLKAAERGNPTPQDLCRKLGEICLIQWGDQPTIPEDDLIDAVDDQAMMQLFLDLIDGTNNGDFEVLADRSHQIELSVGSLTLRRLTRKDIKFAENSKLGRVAIDILTAASATIAWWRSDRAIMPADFDALPLADYGRLSAALQGFLLRRTDSN